MVGLFITLYVDAKDLKKFEQYSDALKNMGYDFLINGDDVMHDYAHLKQNKGFLSLFSASKPLKLEHFHIVCPTLANESHLTKILNQFYRTDLPCDVMETIIKEYRQKVPTWGNC